MLLLGGYQYVAVLKQRMGFVGGLRQPASYQYFESQNGAVSGLSDVPEPSFLRIEACHNHDLASLIGD